MKENQGAWKLWFLAVITLGIHPIWKMARLQEELIRLSK